MLRKYLPKYRYGIKLIANGEYEEAYNYFSQTADTDPYARFYLLQIDYSFLKRIPMDEVETELEKLLYLGKEYEKASYPVLSHIAFIKQNIDKSANYARKALALGIDNEFIHFVIASSILSDNTATKKDILEAFEHLNFIDDENDLIKESLIYTKVSLLIKNGDLEEASNLIYKNAFCANNYSLYNLLTLKLLVANDASTKEIIEAYKKVISNDDDFIEGNLEILNYYEKKNMLNDALEIIDLLLTKTSDPSFIYRKGIILAKTGKFIDAISLFKEHLNEFVFKAEILYSIGIWTANEDKIEAKLEGIKYLEESIKEFPDPYVINSLFNLYYSCHFYDEIRKLALYVKKMHIKGTGSVYYMARYFYFNRNMKKTLNLYKKSYKEDIIDEFEYLEFLVNTTKNGYKYFDKYREYLIAKKDDEFVRSLTSQMLYYGEYGSNIDEVEAKRIINDVIKYDHIDDDVKARYLLSENYQEGKKYIIDAYNRQESTFTPCDNLTAFYAHILIQEGKKEEALILLEENIRKFQGDASENVFNLYTFLNLDNKDKYQELIHLQKRMNTDVYYSLTRLYMLMLIYEKMNKKLLISKIKKQIDVALKYVSKRERAWFLDLIQNKKPFYPFLTNN